MLYIFFRTPVRRSDFIGTCEDPAHLYHVINDYNSRSEPSAINHYYYARTDTTLVGERKLTPPK